MSRHPRVRATRFWCAAIGGIALILATASVILAEISPDPGPFIGCLATKTTKSSSTSKGVVYNVAKGSAPTASCLSGDLVITFSNGQGPKGDPGPQGPSGAPGPAGGPLANLSSLNGVACTTVAGGSGEVRVSSDAPGTVLVVCASTATAQLTVTKRGGLPGVVSVQFLDTVTACRETCTYDVPLWSPVHLMQMATEQAVFGDWESEACPFNETNRASCYFTMDGPIEVSIGATPSFDAALVTVETSVIGAHPVYAPRVLVNGNEGCQPTEGGCTIALPVGSQATFVAERTRGMNFKSWDGLCASVETDSCTVAITGGATVRATYVYQVPVSFRMSDGSAFSAGINGPNAGDTVNCSSGSCVVRWPADEPGTAGFTAADPFSYTCATGETAVLAVAGSSGYEGQCTWTSLSDPRNITLVRLP